MTSLSSAVVRRDAFWPASWFAVAAGESRWWNRPPSPRRRWRRERPSRWLNLLGSTEDWNLATEPSAALAGRSLRWPRGRGLGGSSRINAMIWFPPTPQDLQQLSAASGGGWSLAELAKSLQQVEAWVKPQRPRWLSESSRRFMDAASSLQDAQPMVYYRVNREGRRWTPAQLLAGFDSRLRIVRATVDQVLVDSDNVIGVQVQVGTSSGQIRCRHGVVLCAGAIATPTILMRSGIGPRDVLRQAGIDRRFDAPRVGVGLQDHLVMPVIFGLQQRYRFEPQPSMRDLARWQTLGGGPVSSNIAECGGLFDGGKYQIHVTPTHYLTHPQSNSPAAMTLAVNMTRPVSRGRITITSSDPNRGARIEAGYLSDETDLRATIDGVGLCRTISKLESLAKWHLGEILPGPKRVSDESIAKSIRRYAQTLYHPVGTCQMGTSPDSVVDPSFRVRGLQNLWVADASILPSLPAGNPNASVMTVALHCGQRLERPF